MNRHERRAEKAQARKLPPARRDGRPLYFDISPNDLVQCVECLKAGVRSQYKQGEAFLNDPANSPEDDGAVYTVCKGHIPDNSVIYHPGDKTCRNKAGDATWYEGEKQ